MKEFHIIIYYRIGKSSKRMQLFKIQLIWDVKRFITPVHLT